MRFVSLGLVVTMLLSLFGCTAKVTETIEDTVLVTESEQPDTLVYVSLGDSIARGYGLADIEAERFSTIAGKVLTEALPDTAVSVYNYGIDGLTAGGLWDKLTDGQITIPADTDVISISLGANHIISNIFAFLSDATRALANEACGTELLANVEQNCQLFAGELTLTLDEIHKVAPDAKIYFLTFYDPFPHLQLDGFSNTLIDSCVQQINDVIYATAVSEGFTVVDVYTAFAEAQETLLFAKIPDHSLTNNDLNGLDPHPNAVGHQVIGTLIGNAILADITD